MIVRDCNFLMTIVTKIEKIISDLKTQHPDLTDEEILERVKIKLKQLS